MRLILLYYSIYLSCCSIVYGLNPVVIKCRRRPIPLEVFVIKKCRPRPIVVKKCRARKTEAIFSSSVYPGASISQGLNQSLATVSFDMNRTAASNRTTATVSFDSNQTMTPLPSSSFMMTPLTSDFKQTETIISTKSDRVSTLMPSDLNQTVTSASFDMAQTTANVSMNVNSTTTLTSFSDLIRSATVVSSDSTQTKTSNQTMTSTSLTFRADESSRTISIGENPMTLPTFPYLNSSSSIDSTQTTSNLSSVLNGTPTVTSNDFNQAPTTISVDVTETEIVSPSRITTNFPSEWNRTKTWSSVINRTATAMPPDWSQSSTLTLSSKSDEPRSSTEITLISSSVVLTASEETERKKTFTIPTPFPTFPDRPGGGSDSITIFSTSSEDVTSKISLEDSQSSSASQTVSSSQTPIDGLYTRTTYSFSSSSQVSKTGSDSSTVWSTNGVKQSSATVSVFTGQVSTDSIYSRGISSITPSSISETTIASTVSIEDTPSYPVTTEWSTSKARMTETAKTQFSSLGVSTRPRTSTLQETKKTFTQTLRSSISSHSTVNTPTWTLTKKTPPSYSTDYNSVPTISASTSYLTATTTSSLSDEQTSTSKSSSRKTSKTSSTLSRISTTRSFTASYSEITVPTASFSSTIVTVTNSTVTNSTTMTETFSTSETVPTIPPTPFPSPRPIPVPRPVPLPWPVPRPQPAPLPQPVPRPQPGPLPQPIPVPRPVPLPQPIPRPQPVPMPQPVLRPQPVPMPQPVPRPQPAPLPRPIPRPQPVPRPQPAPRPQTAPRSPTTPKPKPPPKPFSGGGKMKAKGDSPLIFDMDHDGKVSVIKGIGVNMNSEHPTIRNGAATAGDKMLAMCDFSGNGEIDYREVFGDGTVDPFTGVHLKAANGFIALYEIANSAMRQFKDMKIVSENSDQGTMVNVQLLRLALKRIGCDLGLISDENVYNLESLGNIEWVKVTKYRESLNDEINGVVFAQKSWYLDSLGERWGVDDVWFPSI